jgi:hypothetical protein
VRQDRRRDGGRGNVSVFGLETFAMLLAQMFDDGKI